MATTYDRQHFTTAGQPHYTTTGQQPHFRYEHTGDKLIYPHQQQGPSSGKIMAIMALLPLGAILLGLAGLTFIGTIIGLVVATPVFIIFSPVIVPAVLTIALAVTGFLASGTFGLTGLSSLSYLVNIIRQTAGSVPEGLDYAREKIEDLGVYAGQKTKEAGQTIQNKAHDLGNVDVGVGQGHQGGGVGVHVQAGGGKEGGKGGKGGDRT